MRYLFPHFLDDIREYEEAQAFWADLCARVLARHSQSEAWSLFFHEVELDDGSILRDGNPIYSIVNTGELKGVRVIQCDPKVHTRREMAAWVDVSGDEYSVPGPITELVFSCNLTQESVSIFEKLFEAWIQPECTAQEITRMIREYEIG